MTISPALSYPYKMKPFKHQMTLLERSWDKREYAFFMEMGTGKSKSLIDTVAMLYDNNEITGFVLVAPKGVFRNWSNKELPEHMPDHITTRTAVWNRALNKQTKADINNLFVPNDELNILVINIDALNTPKGYMVIEKFLNAHNALMGVDESTIIKTPSARRTKAAIKLGTLAAYRRILTGSPVTKSPLDLYTQCEFLNPHLLGFSSFYAFRRRYAILKDSDFGGRKFKQVVGFQNVEELKGMMDDFTYRITKDECLDLPEKIFMRREFDLSKEQKKAYDDMKDMAIAFFDEGEATVTAVITQIMRLHQISCGFLPIDDSDEIIEFKNDRLSNLMEVLEETDGKVIIWANYRHDIFMLQKAIAKAYGPESLVSYFGDTKDDERVRAVQEFQRPDSPVRFFLGNTQTGGYGITLTEASTVVYYSNNYDLEKRLQSEDRAHRIGQHHPVTYVDLVCRNTVDEKIIDALRKKISMANVINGDTWKEWL